MTFKLYNALLTSTELRDLYRGLFIFNHINRFHLCSVEIYTLR
jgi:hypothetical protein